MVNAFYNVSGNPGTGGPLASAAIRAEFTAIAAGFDKLPTTLTANKAVVVNSGGTALTITAGSLALGGDFTVSGSSALTLTTTGATNVTLPTAGTLVAQGGVLGTPSSGTLTNCTGLPAAGVVAGALADGMTATTQIAGDSSTKLATTAGVLAEIALAIPAGVIVPYGGSAAPTGWLLCFGQAVSRTTYAGLFTALSTTYGVGDGSTTFNLPDLRGRVPPGRDDMGGSAAGRLTGTTMAPDGITLGATGGTQTHTHSIGGPSLTEGAEGNAPTINVASHLHVHTAVVASSLPPAIVLNYIIRI